MKNFAFVEPASVAAAVEQLKADPGSSRPIAGGSDLLGELKDGTVHYERLVSLRRIESLRAILPVAGDEGGGLRLGAGVTLTQLEHEPRLAGPYRILAEAARGVATPEIRNQGTLGGNLCQRPRCLHYRSAWIACAKKGGAGCPAAESRHQPYLSVFGGAGCVCVHASDLAPPLLALGASAVVAGAHGERNFPLAGFFAGPEADVRRENILSHGEILTAVLLPALPPDWRGTYLKARERTAGDFPLVSVAFGCRLEQGRMRDVRLVLGGVAPVPRPCPEAEAALERQAPSREAAERAADLAFARATPLEFNGFKIDLGRSLLTRAIEQAGASA